MLRNEAQTHVTFHKKMFVTLLQLTRFCLQHLLPLRQIINLFISTSVRDFSICKQSVKNKKIIDVYRCPFFHWFFIVPRKCAFFFTYHRNSKTMIDSFRSKVHTFLRLNFITLNFTVTGFRYQKSNCSILRFPMSLFVFSYDNDHQIAWRIFFFNLSQKFFHFRLENSRSFFVECRYLGDCMEYD